MKRRVLLFVAVPLLMVAHFMIHVGFSVGAAAPDLLTLALLLAAREVGMGTAAGLGFFLGVLEDAFSVLAFGASAMALTLVGALGSGTRDLFVGDSPLFIFAYLGLGKLLRDLVYWIVADSTVRGPFLDGVVVGGGLGALSVAILGLLLVRIFGVTRELA